MADDIDIEEHDLLDNPRIQDMLRIKEEPIDLDDDYEESAPAYVHHNQYEYNTEDNYGQGNEEIPPDDQVLPPCHQDLPLDDQGPHSDGEEQPSDELEQNLADQEDPPDIELDELNEEFDESASEIEREYTSNLSDEIYHHKNKIILGSKPCKRPIRDVKGAYVSLEDWGDRLENSLCYCKECKTLFATQNALDAHNMTAHSFLVALDSPVSQEAETVTPQKSDAAKYCDHCKKFFPDYHALIQHLYDLIIENKQNTPVKYNDCTNTGQHIVYSCLICNMGFLDMKGLRGHARSAHKKSEIGNYERVPFTGVCKTCKRTFKQLKGFNDHVKVCHADRNGDLLAENNESLEMEMGEVESQVEEDMQPVAIEPEMVVAGPSKVVKKTDKSSLITFKCIKCKTFFKSYKSIYTHQRRFHIGEKIIKKIGPKSVVSKQTQNISKKRQTVKKVLEKTKTQDSFKFSDNLVPKNCLFHCVKCDIHFVTCWSAILHANCVDKTLMSRYECDICCKMFRLKDMKTHLNQHKYNDAFTVHSIAPNMNCRMLFWCQKCAVYFDVKKIESHASVCSGTSSSIRCKVCEIDLNDILSHMEMHSKRTAKSDFIFIDDLLPKEEISQDEDLKRKRPVEESPVPSKVMKIDKLDAVEFMYCDSCHTCMKSCVREFHISGVCKQYKSKRNCEFCGLVFVAGTPANFHEEFHKKSNVKFKDFTFVKVTDMTPTVPVIPEFPKCDRCDTYILSTSSHNCGSSKSCKICQKKFSERAHKLHLLHHKYLKQDTEVDELIKRYETLPSTWNILYLCTTCNVATDSYDDMVSHCQNHYNNIVDCAIRNCDPCNLLLEENCFKRHNELHSPSITKESFKTVGYDYRNLLNDDWLKLFGTLSKAEVHQIVTRSIYVTRFVKMKLILDGPPEYTIYKCETCKLYVDSTEIYNHTMVCLSSACAKKAFSCEICGIPFSTLTARKEHENLHSAPNITANSFRIVAFNSDCDRDFNSNLQVDTFEFHSKPNINVSPVKQSVNTKNVIFYKCRQCKCCSPNAQSLIRHTCLNESEIVQCKKCNLYTSVASEKDHRKWHKQRNDITKDQIKVLVIDNKHLLRKQQNSEGSEVGQVAVKKTVYKLHQCKKCKVCYSFWVKHTACTTESGRRRCKKCGYVFSMSSYNLHSIWHNLNANATKSDIKIVPLAPVETERSKIEKRKFLLSINRSRMKENPEVTYKDDKRPSVFQCYKCKLASYTVSFVKKHTICSTAIKGKYDCKICNLTFKYIGMKFHKAWHRENKSHGRQHLKVLQFKGMKILKTENKKTKNLEIASKSIVSIDSGYRCTKCGSKSKASIFLKKHKCVVTKFKPRWTPYVYYQCQDCEACSTSKRHDCVPPNRIRVCPKCKLKFTTSSLHDHMQKHAKYKEMTRAKITIKPFRNYTEPKNDEAPPVPAEKVSTVYRCTCGLHFISQKTIEKHVTVCSPGHDIPAENCSKCGLLFPTNHLVSHLCNHHSYGKGNIEVKTIDTITLYRCGSCKCLFMTESRVVKHTESCYPGNYKRVTCEECDLVFHETEIKMHKDSHKSSTDLKKPCRIVTVNKNTSKSDDKEHNNVDAEMETGTEEANQSATLNESKNKYDHILYKCSKCEIHFLHKKSLLYHIANKYCKKNQQNCTRCGLAFTQYTLTKHTRVHHETLDLGVEDFVIDTFDYKTSKFLSRTGAVRIIHDEKPTNVDLFKCHICQVHFLKSLSLRNHIVSSRSHRTVKVDCEKCGLAFMEKVLEWHTKLHHDQLNLSIENFNIIERRDFVPVPRSEESTEVKDGDSFIATDDDSQLDELETTTLDNVASERVYYNCIKCNIVFLNARTIEFHCDDHKQSSTATCDICGLVFNAYSMVTHKEHHRNKSAVFLIQDVGDESTCVNKIHKCLECGVHFLRSITLMYHMAKGNHTIKKSGKCPECGLLFTKITLKLHMKLHHGDNNFQLEDFVIDTSIGKYRRHVYGEDNNVVPNRSSEALKIDDNESVEVKEENPENDSSINKSPTNSTKLYKCGKCNVYFLTQATCYKHIVKHVPMDPKEYIECKLCSFQFRIVSLNTHIRKHHKTQFEFDKVLIEEYQPKSDEDKAPKIDIYYAKDKVQSRLISTTTEDNSAEVSQSEMDPTDPEASSDSRDTDIINYVNDLETKTVLDSDNKNVMVKIPSFTEVKEENDSIVDESGPKTDEGVRIPNEGVLNSNANAANVIEDLLKEKSPHETRLACKFCDETFVSRRAKDFHESLDHLDALKDCPICKKRFNASVLNELHLNIKNDVFFCCICSQSESVEKLPDHSYMHNNML